MSDRYDDEDEFELPTDAVAKAKYRLRHEGIPAAVDALIDVARDRKAPAPARASAGNTILRANGLLNTAAAELDDKPPEEMSAAELNARIQQINVENRELAVRRAEIDRQRTGEQDEGGDEENTDESLFD
ncbi:MAG: hypothetical protein ACAH22_00035 [Tardiphaga sp.]